MTLAVFSDAPMLDLTDPSRWVLVPKHIAGGMRSALAQVDVMDSYQTAFEAVLAEAPSPPSDAEALGGWVWIPRQITTAMWKAWEQSTMVSVDEQEDYAALLAAAPALPDEARTRFDRFHLAGPKPVFPSSRVLVERGLLGVKHFDTEGAHARWKSLPWWRRLFS